MARKVKFKIARFQNPSGEKGHRVSDSLGSKQIRKNFKTRTSSNNSEGVHSCLDFSVRITYCGLLPQSLWKRCKPRSHPFIVRWPAVIQPGLVDTDCLVSAFKGQKEQAHQENVSQ